MTTQNTPATAELEDAKIEQSVKVYLEWDEVNRRWIVDPVTVDGHSLDGLDGADADLFPEYRTPEFVAEMAAADEAPLPTADQLVMMLLEALPEESTAKNALSEIVNAARSWAEELTTYIAKASDDYGDKESAASQRDTAAAIHAAIKLLKA